MSKKGDRLREDRRMIAVALPGNRRDRRRALWGQDRNDMLAEGRAGTSGQRLIAMSAQYRARTRAVQRRRAAAYASAASVAELSM